MRRSLGLSLTLGALWPLLAAGLPLSSQPPQPPLDSARRPDAVPRLPVRTPDFAGPLGCPGARKNRWIVVFHEIRRHDRRQGRSHAGEPNVASLARDLARQHGGELHLVYQHALHGFSATFCETAIEALRKHPAVSLVEPDQPMHLDAVQSPAPSWGLDRIDECERPLDNRYDYNLTGAGVHVYVVDTGIRQTHKDFVGRLGNGHSVVGGNPYSDVNGHGTHVAGTVGGATYGVAKEVTLHSVKVADAGTFPTSNAVAAVDWITANRIPPSVANLSIGGPVSASLDLAVSNSIAAGITYVTSAGNSSANACEFSPAGVPEAITVGASNAGDQRMSGTNYGPCIDLFAPGRDIVSASHQSDTGKAVKSGTSMASPHVAGVAALLLERIPNASPAHIRRLLVNAGTHDRLVHSPPFAHLGPGSPNILLSRQVHSLMPEWLWGNGGSGWIGHWNIRTSTDEHYIPGDFDGDHRDEVLAINVAHDTSRILRLDGNQWKTAGFLHPDSIDPGNRYVAGNFDGGEDDELLVVRVAPAGSESASLLKLLPGTGTSFGTWVELWSTGTEWLGAWKIRSPNRLVAGDFDASGRDLLLAIDAGGSHLLEFVAGPGSWKTVTVTADSKIYWWNIHLEQKLPLGIELPGDIFLAADFDEHPGDELLAISLPQWTHLMTYEKNNGWGYRWGSGEGRIHWWHMNRGDKFLAIDADGDGKASLLAVKDPWSHLMDFGGGSWQGGDWTWQWGTDCGSIHTWFINPPDKYLSGNFLGDEHEELLTLNPANDWAQVLRFFFPW